MEKHFYVNSETFEGCKKAHENWLLSCVVMAMISRSPVLDGMPLFEDKNVNKKFVSRVKVFNGLRQTSQEKCLQPPFAESCEARSIKTISSPTID